MGLIWNTAATQQFIATLNQQFSGDTTQSSQAPDGTTFFPPIARWRAITGDFASKTLLQIVIDQNLHAGADAGSDENGRWKNWLTDLIGVGPHNRLRKMIKDALDDNSIDEIVFVVVPRAHGNSVTVDNPEDVPDYDPGRTARVITVHTPTARAMRILARQLARARRAGGKVARKKVAKKATKKKAAKKKKA
jgi:hypothetical protein